MTNQDDSKTGDLFRDFVKFRSQEAFAALADRYTSLVYHTALRRTGSEALAADVVQEVFIALAKQAPSLRADERLGAWLHRRALYVASTLLRSEARRRKREQTAAAMNIDDPVPASVWKDAVPELDRALDALPAKDRQALVLRYLEGRNLTEVGDAVGATKDAAQKRISRALTRLKDLLTRRGISLSAAVLVQGIISESAKAAPAGLSKRASAAALASVAKGGAGLWFLRWQSALRSGLAGIAGAVAVCALPLLAQYRTIAAMESQVPGPRPMAASVSAASPPAPVSSGGYQGKSLEEIIGTLAALLESDTNAVDTLRLGMLMDAIPAEDAASALTMLEKQLSSRARARSETHGLQIRCALMRNWAKREPLAALENLVSRFHPDHPMELPASGDWLSGAWFDVAERSFTACAAKDRKSALRWYFDALRSGRLDYQRRGESSLLQSINRGIDSIWYDADPHLVIDAGVESINRTGDQFVSGSILSRDWDGKNVEYKLKAVEAIKHQWIRSKMIRQLEEQRLGQWVKSDVLRARAWLATQPEETQRNWFAQTVFPPSESRPVDQQGSDWTPHIEWALKTRPGDCAEDKLPSLIAPWLHHDANRSVAWVCAHTTGAKTMKDVTVKMISLLKVRSERARSAEPKFRERYKVYEETTLKATLQAAAEWQRRDPQGARAGAEEIVRNIKPWPALSDPILTVLTQ